MKCSTCNLNSPRPGQRTCAECHANYQRQWRRTEKAKLIEMCKLEGFRIGQKMAVESMQKMGLETVNGVTAAEIIRGLVPRFTGNEPTAA